MEDQLVNVPSDDEAQMLGQDFFNDVFNPPEQAAAAGSPDHNQEDQEGEATAGDHPIDIQGLVVGEGEGQPLEVAVGEAEDIQHQEVQEEDHLELQDVVVPSDGRIIRLPATLDVSVPLFDDPEPQEQQPQFPIPDPEPQEQQPQLPIPDPVLPAVPDPIINEGNLQPMPHMLLYNGYGNQHFDEQHFPMLDQNPIFNGGNFQQLPPPMLNDGYGNPYFDEPLQMPDPVLPFANLFHQPMPNHPGPRAFAPPYVVPQVPPQPPIPPQFAGHGQDQMMHPDPMPILNPTLNHPVTFFNHPTNPFLYTFICHQQVLGLPGSNRHEKPHDLLRMYTFKVADNICTTDHSWRDCSLAHHGERAARRHPLNYRYDPRSCAEYRANGVCSKGVGCGDSHGEFELGLHTCFYRTKWCFSRLTCNRRVCFYAHTEEEFRQVTYHHK